MRCRILSTTKTIILKTRLSHTIRIKLLSFLDYSSIIISTTDFTSLLSVTSSEKCSSGTRMDPSLIYSHCTKYFFAVHHYITQYESSPVDFKFNKGCFELSAIYQVQELQNHITQKEKRIYKQVRWSVQYFHSFFIAALHIIDN